MKHQDASSKKSSSPASSAKGEKLTQQQQQPQPAKGKGLDKNTVDGQQQSGATGRKAQKQQS